MRRIIFFILSFLTFLSANTSLMYKVYQGNKQLGLYEIDYNTNGIVSKSYGVANKIKFFVDKKIDYIKSGYKNVKYIKNNQKVLFDVWTKKSVLPNNLLKRYKRNLRKVKKDDMLLLLKNGKKNIELFNKRKTNILTLDEVIKIALDNKIKNTNFLLFDKMGVMKMIAKIVPTNEGFDIINKSKSKKYIKVIIKNNIPVEIKSYLSNWSLKIYGAGKFKVEKISKNELKNFIKNTLDKKFDNIAIKEIKKFKIKKKYILVYYIANLKMDNISADVKRVCFKSFKKYSKKVTKLHLNNNICEANLQTKISKKDIIDKIVDKLVKKYPQLKYTKKIKVTKKGVILYKILNRVN